MMAADGGHVEVMRLLLEAGADKDLANNQGTTALMMAEVKGQVEVLRLLLEAGADKSLADNRGVGHTPVALCQEICANPRSSSGKGQLGSPVVPFCPFFPLGSLIKAKQ